MIVCTTDRQKAFLNNIKRQKIINVQTIIDFAKSYLELDDNITKLSEILDSFSTEKEEFINYLQNIANVSIKEAGEGEIEIKGPKKPQSPSNVSPNFIAANVDLLFTEMHIAHLHFKQNTNKLLLSAAYIGDRDKDVYASNSEITENMNSLKNDLFTEIVDYLVLNGILKEEDYFENVKVGENIVRKSLVKLFDSTGFNPRAYKNHYKLVMSLLENHLLSNSDNTVSVPNSNQKIPALFGPLEDPIAKKRYDVYNAAILLLNFDTIVLSDFAKILGVDKTTFNTFEQPLNGPKYFRKVKGLETTYFKDDGVTTGGVEEFENKLSHSLVSIIPIYNSDKVLTTNFMEMKDLYGLGAKINDFQTKNFAVLSKLEDWTILEEDPIRMLTWYSNRIIEAYDREFLSTASTQDSLAASFWEDFRHKVNMVVSLKNFLEVIKTKEENSINFSMARIITQPLINSVGAVYSSDGIDKHHRSYKEMHAHNSERVQLQESIYGHLKNKLSNWEKVYYNKATLRETLKNLDTGSLRKVINNLTGIHLNTESLRNLIEKWTSNKGIGRDLTNVEKLEALVGKIHDMVVRIFPETEEVDVVIKATKESPSKTIKVTKGLYKKSLFEAIAKNELNIEKLSYDQINTTNEVISSLSSSTSLGAILDEQLKSIKAIVLTKVSKQDGKPIPTSVIPSLGFNDSALLLERLKLERSEKDRLYKNYFANNGGLKGTVIRLESLNGEDAKDSALLKVVENFTSHFEFDFLESLKVLPEGSTAIDDVNIMIGNYADKSRILDKRISSTASLNGKAIIKSTAPGTVDRKGTAVMNSKEVWEESRKQSLNYYTDLAISLINTYLELIPNLIPKKDIGKKEYFFDTTDGTAKIDYIKIKKLLEKINNHIKKIDYNSFLKLTNSLKGNFVKELHYSVYKEGGTSKISLNQTILDYLDIYSDINIFDKFVERQRESFLYKILDYKPNGILMNAHSATKLSSSKDGYDENIIKMMVNSIGYDYEDYKKFFVEEIKENAEETSEEISGDISTIEDDLEEINVATGNHRMYIITNNKIILNPLVEKWLSVNEFFRNEYLYMSIKPEYIHPPKSLEDRSKNTTIDDFLDSFSKESGLRLVGMAKRNVSITGSTELPTRGSRVGTTDDVNVAVIDDYKANIPLVSGKNVKQALHDGSTLLTYSYSKMIDHSYQGKGMEGAKKQLATFVTEFGSALKKDAESDITNASIRASNRSEIRLRDKQFQAHSIPIFIDNFDSGLIRTNNTFFKDGDYYAINSYTIKDNEVSYYMSKYDGVNKVWVSIGKQPPVIIKNLFDFWELFGGEDSVDENFEFNEGSNESVFSLITTYKVKENSPYMKRLKEVDFNAKELAEIKATNGYVLKNKMIHIISNHSCFKSGASNLHGADYWLNAEKLKYTTYRNRHMGIQLDATHEIEDSKIKEVTQMISALSQNPDTAEQAEEMYQTLADIIEDSIKKTYKKGYFTQEKNLKDLYKTLSNSLVRSLNNSANVGLAKTIAQTFEHGQLLPFSNQNFFRDFIKDLVVRMNKDFITRYYQGTGGILTASHGIATVLENNKGEVFSQADIRELAIKHYNNNKSFYAPNLTTEGIINTYIEAMFADELVDAEELQLLDSVNIGDKIEKLDTIEKYYAFKETYKGLKVKKSLKTSRDLKPIEISYSTKRLFENKEGLLEEKIVKRTLWDSIPMKLKFLKYYSTPELKNLMSQFKEKFKIDESTLEGKKKLDLMLNLWLHRENQMLSRGRSLHDITESTFTVNGVTDFDKYFGVDFNTKEIKDNLSSIVIEDYIDHYNTISSELITYDKKAAELIMANIYSETFDTGKDSVGFVRSKGSEYFKEKLRQYYKYDPTIKADFKIATKERDIYVRFVPKNELPQVAASKLKGFLIDDFDEEGIPKKIRVSSFGETLYELPKHSVVNILPDYDVLYIESGERESVVEQEENGISKSIKKFVPYKNINWTLDELLKSFDSNVKAIVPIMNNYIKDDTKLLHNFNKQVYELFKLYSGYTPKNYESFNGYLKNNLESILDQVSKRTYVSWEKSTQFVASRIPAQSMQSFMEMKNVGYFNTNNNEIYVSIWQIVIQGSDFDIDKAYLMGYGFNKMGHYEVASDAFKFTTKESLEAIEALPKSSRKTTSFTSGNKEVLDISLEFNKFVESFENLAPNSSGKIEDWLEEISNLEEYTEDMLAKGISIPVKSIQIVGDILRKIKDSNVVNINYSYKPLINREYQENIFNEYKKVLVNLVNNHNTSKNYTKNKFSQINANVSNIRKIISDPANQLWANSPVDFDPFNEGADEVIRERTEKRETRISEILENNGADTNLENLKDSLKILAEINSLYNVTVLKSVKTLGEYIKEAKKIDIIKNTLSAHDMISMFKQQSDAIIGKKDVGIGANGLKVMFALNSYYNKYYKSLSVRYIDKAILNSKGKVIDPMKDPKWFEKTLNMGDKIGTVTKATIADVWLNEDLKGAITNNLGLETQKSLLNIVQSGMAAIYISGFVSAATDNAKELIMAKINAINELASMHLYLMMLGFTAEEVSSYMTSDLANHVVSRINSANIYESSKGMSVNNIIKSYIKNNPSKEGLANTFLDVYQAAQEVSNLAGLLKINQSTSADINSMFLFLNKFNTAMYTREHAVLEENLWKLNSEEHLDEAVQIIMDKNPKLSEAYIKDVLGRASNIKVNTINEKGEIVTKITSLLAGGFDFRYYIENDNANYRNIAIEYYNLFKNTINIFDVIEDSTHFKSMIKGLSNVHMSAMIVSKKYNFVFNTALDIIREKSPEIYNNNQKTIKNYLGNSKLVINLDDRIIGKLLRGYDGFVVSAWTKTNDLKDYQISVKTLLKQSGLDKFEAYVSDDAKIYPIGKSSEGTKIISADSEEDLIIDLTTDFGIANFKKAMEELIFPILKRSQSSQLGSLLRLKSLRNPYGLFTSQITPTFGISSLDNAVNVTKYQALLHDFNQVDFKIESGNKIEGKNKSILRYKDLFYLYNLIVNNEQYGDNRLTPIFQDYVKDRNSIAYKYLDFSRKIDLREVDIFKIDIDPTLSDGSKNVLYDKLLHSFKNDVIFLALNKRGAVNVKRLGASASTQIAVRNPHFIINTHADVSANIDVEKYTQYSSLLSILNNSNLLINFKCD